MNRLALSLLCSALFLSCNRPAPTAPSPQKAEAAKSVVAPSPPPPPPPPLSVVKADARYVAFVRTLFTRHGCDAGPCHGTFKGGGLYFMSPRPDYPRDYQVILERLDRKDPQNSILLKKALGKVPHAGGKNLSESECDTQKLVAWIGEQPDPGCDRPRTDTDDQRFAREVMPALSAMGCAASACHGEKSTPHKLDLSPLGPGPSWNLDQARAVRAAVMGTQVNRTVTWKSPVVVAALGEDAAHKTLDPIDTQSCAFRRFYGYLAEFPESRCDLRADREKDKLSRRPAFTDFAQVIMPALTRRGCTDTSCHGSSNNPMRLFETQIDAHAAFHDYLALTDHIEDPAHPDKSTFLRTVRNQEPHGGGQRLGGQGDCVDALVVSWLHGQKVSACPQPASPSWERYVAEVQPVLDQMTCTQKACHGTAIPSFVLVRHAKDEQSLRKNYEQTIRQIDHDFMPFSQVMLRMREPCAYAVVGAWIEGKPRPDCTVHDPDPSIFPKIESKLNHKPIDVPTVPQKT